MPVPARTPPPPYFAVIFTSCLRDQSEEYTSMADEMDRLARARPGFLGADSSRGADGLGITVSYWTDLESIAGWRDDARHAVARHLGRDRFYDAFAIHVARVERAEHFTRES